MTTEFSLLTQACGLSHREAAEFLGVRIDTVKSWSAGRNPAPDGVLDELRGLAARIDRAVAEALRTIREASPPPDDVEIGVASDDYEAQSLGWPCVGAHRQVAARIAAACPYSVHIVPRGSTPASAAAADAHERTQK